MEKLTRAEKETIARFSEDPEEQMTFETFNKRHALRMIRDGAQVKRTHTRGGSTYWTLLCPVDWFRWPRPPSKARSEASRKALEARGGKVGVRS